MATRTEIKNIVANYIQTNGLKTITAVQLKEILNLISDYYRHQDDVITLEMLENPEFIGDLSADNIIVNSQTPNSLIALDSLKNIVSLDTVTYPSLVEIARVKGLDAPILTKLAEKQATLTASNFHTFVDSLTALTTLSDGDFTNITDNSAGLQKKVTWANIKTNLTSFFNGLYQSILVSGTNIKTINGSSLLGSGDMTIALTVPQSSIIYVDSTNGVNSASGRGDINKPYLTPEYALSNTTNTGTITATTSTNTTLSAISDTNNALLEVGMFVSGSGIPFGTTIVSKGNQGGNANTVTLNRATTATASGVTVSWVKTYEVRLNGNFVVTSNLFKDGMYINSQKSKISWGAFNLFDLSTTVLKTPFYILGDGDYFGTATTSNFINGSGAQTSEFTLNVKFGNIETISTGSSFVLNFGTNETYQTFNGGFVNCRFGAVGSFVGWAVTVNFDSYGLLGGISFSTNTVKSNILRGTHTTPSSVSVFSGGYYTISTANLNGSTTWTGYCSHRGALKGTTHTVGSCDIHVLNRGGGTITCNGGTANITVMDSVQSVILNVNSGVTCNAYGYDITLASITGTLNFYAQSTSDSTIAGGAGLINNYGYIYVVSMGSFTGVFNNWGTIVAGSFGGGGSVNNYGSIRMIYYGINVASGKRFVNRGYINSTGSLLNSNAIITLSVATGVFENYGTIENSSTDITKALIEKSNGTLYLRQGSYLKVANGKSPIKCTANTSASKDVYYFGVTSNCDASTYGLLIAFDGSSYAPNNLVSGSSLFENVNY
ncbi:hypothetical protein UFOVP105_12 [uncultured Caudovirales phage]|uniref:Uncharacterized protein n=1 Tax=uncultured Caudovirales phage TaxID=2100421 RepID=A0A6J5L2R4_9CAUD|nr:hypothetical protein UFOVP105_12 [uncultured Caudovirales phage]